LSRKSIECRLFNSEDVIDVKRWDLSGPFINSGLSVLNSGLLSIDETVRSEELVVPADELSVDSVVVGDEFSVGDIGEVELGVNISKSLLNNVENAVYACFVGECSSRGKILLISSEPDHNIF
jgi:hypothetical protein